MSDPAIKQNCACQHALEQKANAWPAFRETGEETLQTFSPFLR